MLFKFAQSEQRREAEELISSEDLQKLRKGTLQYLLRREYASENGTELNP